MVTTDGYVLEHTVDGRALIATGPWTAAASKQLDAGMADVLVLNYALGFSESNLDFIDPGWPISRLDVLAREITDLTPIRRLNHSLRKLSIQASPGATLDLGGFGRLTSVGAEWAVIGQSIRQADNLTEILTFRYPDTDLRAFRDFWALQSLTLKQTPFITTLEGVETLPVLASIVHESS